MNKTAEMEIRVSGGRIVDTSITKDGAVRLTIKSDEFVLVEASKLSLGDDFMDYRPRTERQIGLRNDLTRVIACGIKDFYRPVMDPSLDENGQLCFIAGNKPAVGKSLSWWQDSAKAFCPERGSRLSRKDEYIGFIGCFLKNLINLGFSKDQAWEMLCDDSYLLGHYCNNNNHIATFEPTGTRQLCGFYDLGNTEKILNQNNCFFIVGGSWNHLSSDYPLGKISSVENEDDVNYAVGLIVLEK